MKQYTPLVSIIVVTYNSSEYVLETLDSIKAQTYRNLELIVSDDCSSDFTVEICRNWIKVNSDRFINSEIIISNSNTGIPNNCNRGLYAAKGDWIKFIGADDILLQDCIYLLINEINNYKKEDIGLLHGRVIFIDNNGNQKGESQAYNKTIFPSFNEEFRSNKVISPTVLFNHRVLSEIKGFNYRYKIEDIWIYLKILSLNKKCIFLKHLLVKYRVHNRNTSNNGLLMCKEHIKVLRSFNRTLMNKYNFYLFSKNVLFSKLIKKDSLFEYFKLFQEETFSISLLFFDLSFWFKVIKGYLKTL